MPTVRRFNVVPALPPQLQQLRELAYNLRWTWDPASTDLFRRLDVTLWRNTGHNPVALLGQISQERLNAAADDDGYLAALADVWEEYERELKHSRTWYSRQAGPDLDCQIAYFSLEFGLTECLPIYSGGLGVLAGDHLKSSSELGLPLIGVGVLYQRGFFHQYLAPDGWQLEQQPEIDYSVRPVQIVRDEAGQPITIAVDMPGRQVHAQIWRAQVGRVPLLLLDTNIPQNASPEDRAITDQLYAGDAERRIRQEILLGIGGIRALHRLGYKPTVFHMNEGHSAFLGLERIRLLMQERHCTFAEALEATAPGNVFTTHTPVPAGIDRFGPDLIDRYFGWLWPQLGLSRHDFLALGRLNPNDEGEPFNMAVFALRLAANANGVSKLHARVSRLMWQSAWPEVPTIDIPIQPITNGIHLRSWISPEMQALYDRYLGPRWRQDPDDFDVWQEAQNIPAEELWRVHERRRERLVGFARRRLREQLQHRGAPQTDVEQAGEVLSPDALTIGFARRFAVYKRATLLFRDVERLADILNNAQRPVQMIFSGKAHPQDMPAKELIKQIIKATHEAGLRNRIVFIEDYDINIARYLVQGVDLWLNSPRRPLEASGTSGMKVAANGGLNCSVLDGWWAEAYNTDVGWAIGRGEEYTDTDYQDAVESSALYDLLERDIIPTFYERGRDGLPRRWITKMKNSITQLAPVYNTNRMVLEYATRFYLPAARRTADLMADDLKRARALAAWQQRVSQEWPKLHVVAVQSNLNGQVTAGDEVKVTAQIYLDGLTPDDVAIDLYAGRVNPDGQIVDGTATPMRSVGAPADGVYTFEGSVKTRTSGEHGFAIRALPHHPDLANPYAPHLILWS